MTPSIVFTPEAEVQLVELRRHIAAAGSAEVAARYVESIAAFWKDPGVYSHRGRARDDIRSGLRTVGFKRRVVVALVVFGQGVVIVGVFYGRNDWNGDLDRTEQIERALDAMGQ